MHERDLAPATTSSPSSTPSHLLKRNAAKSRGYYCPKSIVLLYKFTAGEESALSTYHKSGISQEVANTQCTWCFMATGSIDE